MKEFVGTLLKSGIPFGIIMGVPFGLIFGSYRVFLSGIFAGLLFGLLISTFAQIQSIKYRKIRSEIAKGKDIIMDGGVNHFCDKEAVGGWLVLTSDEIIFTSHSFNFQNHQTVIPLKQVSQVKAILTKGLVPNGIEITKTDGKKDKFVVNNRKTWIQKINELVMKPI